MGAWYLQDVFGPLAVSLLVVGCASFVVPLEQFNIWGRIAGLGLIWGSATLAAILSTGFIRNICFRYLVNMRGTFNG